MTMQAMNDPIPDAVPLDAVASDPVALGWMQGSPPPADKQVRFDDGSMFRFPQLRWAYSNMPQLVPTTAVSRGTGGVCPLPRADRDDLDAIAFTPLHRSDTMTWAQSLPANYTDGIVVLHRGHIVYERYFGALSAAQPHIAFSVTKSLFGTIAATLVEQGRLDPAAPVVAYVPELAASGLALATVRQVMDMTTSIDYSEDYADPQAGVWDHGRAGGILARPADYSGPKSFYDFLVTLPQGGTHGEAFAYKTANTDILGWILRRVTGQRLNDMLSERLWAPLGCEQDGRLLVDSAGTEFAGGGFNGCLRDMARFGEMMRCGGVFNGRRIVPQAVVDDIRRGADPALFAPAGYVNLPGASYRNQWWVSHDAHDVFMARGIHGQGIYIDPTAEMVIARFGSHPQAASAGNDPTTLPAYRALALHLMATG
jgi:CubicO group peptidase (beta-lactamase class C family)